MNNFRVNLINSFINCIILQSLHYIETFMFFVFNRSLLDIQNQAGIVMQLNENLIRDREEDNGLILEKPSRCRHGVTGICRYAKCLRSFVRQGCRLCYFKSQWVLDKDTKTPTAPNFDSVTESPKFDLSSIIEAKVGKLVEAKMTELLGSSL